MPPTDDNIIEVRDVTKKFGSTAVLSDLSLDVKRGERLVILGGSGAGKSTVAKAVAARVGPAPGARTISSDRLRKRSFGVSPETRLPADGYRPEVTEAVYRKLAEASGAVLALRHGVVADATAAFESFTAPPLAR